MTQTTSPKTAPSRPRRLGRRALAAATCTSLAATLAASIGLVVLAHSPQPELLVGTVDTAATTRNPVTPGSFKGYAFDQCQAPDQATMNAWMDRSRYLGVGIYIAGLSRGCRTQKNLNATWVARQLHNGWKLLPLMVGPQASCNPHFPRYGDDRRISSQPGKNGTYQRAYDQGLRAASSAVNNAKRLGIVRGSGMYYDLEAFNTGIARCRNSALRFLSGWTVGIHKAGYRSGVYSSASSGIAALDRARIEHQPNITLPDQIWIGDWDGKINTSAGRYISSTGWKWHRRIKQYKGGHNETYGGKTVNIDRDFVDVGHGLFAPKVAHCGGVNLDLPSYPVFKLAGKRPHVAQIKAIKCLLRQAHVLTKGNLDGQYGPYLRQAVHQWKTSHHWRANDAWYREDWVSLLAAGMNRVVKFGSGNESVRYLQRALDAANPRLHLAITGGFDADTRTAVRAYQKSTHLNQNGVVAASTWQKLARGAMR